MYNLNANTRNLNNMRTIQINSKRYGIKDVLVDDADFESLSKFKWSLTVCNGRMYVESRQPMDKKITMHRFVTGATERTVHVDHIDGNGLNNQRNNLRPCEKSQNLWNSGPTKSNSIGFKGVCLHKPTQKYMVQIMANRQKVYGGLFADPVSAAKRWNELSKELHGEFAYQNTI
jgi:hypothetical protein